MDLCWPAGAFQFFFGATLSQAVGPAVRFILERKPMIIIDEMYCKGCGICIHFCPKKVLKASKEVNSRGYYAPQVVNGVECSKCQQCVLYCPDFAIFIGEDKEGGGD